MRFKTKNSIASKTHVIDRMFKSSPIRASVIIRFPAFAEFSEISDSFRKKTQYLKENLVSFVVINGITLGEILCLFQDGIAWQLCFTVWNSNFSSLKQCAQRQPYVFIASALALFVYFVYMLYSRSYLTFPQMGVFTERDVFSDTDYIADDYEYKGRVEKSSVLVNKVLANQKSRSLLIHGNKSDSNKIRAVLAPSEDKTHESMILERQSFIVKKVKALIYSESQLDTPILSEAFSVHSQLKYIHEPLTLTDYEGLLRTEKSELLQHILRCNFQRLYRLGRGKWSLLYGVNYDGTNKYMYEKALCFQKNQLKINCPSKVENLEDLCSLKLHRVVKLASLKFIKDLVALLEEGDQIVHVVRDPRTIVSRKFQEDTQDHIEKHLNDIRIYCNQIERDIDFVSTNLMKYHGSKQYKLLRYEDVERLPFDKMRELCTFLSISVSETDSDVMYFHEDNFNPDMKKSKQSWKYLTAPAVEKIEKDCKKSMKLLGYSNVPNLDKLNIVDLHDLVASQYELDFLS